MEFVEYLRPGARATRGYAERLVSEVPENIFARMPVVRGEPIQINHPAFVLGHLSLYPAQLAEMSGIEVGKMEIPSAYSELFKMGVVCVDDPEGTIYPPKSELVERYFGATDALMERLSEIPRESFDTLLENPSRRERFGTVGAFLAYLLLAHQQTHLGQISAWRRCMGLGAV